MAATAEIPTVVSLVSAVLITFRLNVLKVFLILDLNGAYFSARACGGSADSFL